MAHLPLSDFEQWLSSSPRGGLEMEVLQLKTALVTKHREVEETQGELDQARGEAQHLHTEIERRTRALAFLDEVGPVRARDHDADIYFFEPPADSMSKPEMVERIIQSNFTGMFPREIREEAVRRGWISNDPAAANQFNVAMNRLARANRLIRDPEGRYHLPPNRHDLPALHEGRA